ncbi:MAG: GNAT family N-acetyltransferase [Bacilli bacterium]|nr:GNAT family N-acetyltransferase [Bacilli bacterium]MDY0208978.1 GNAT family N-acetyltransferase [Bacilli bacterium]
MKDSSIELIKKHFCLDDSKLEKGSNVIGFSEQLKKEIMLFELFKNFIIYSDINIFNIIKKNKRMTIDKATKIIGKNSEIDVMNDERYYFLDEETKWKPQHTEGLTIRNLKEEDKKIVETLKKKCKSNEVEMGQVNLYDICPIGGFIGNKLVGIASILNIDEIYDIGVIVHPQHRNLGIGRSLVTHVIAYSIIHNKVVRYLTTTKNGSSMGIAKALDLPEIVRYRKIKLK